MKLKRILVFGVGIPTIFVSGLLVAYTFFRPDALPPAIEIRLLKEDLRDMTLDTDVKISMVGDIMMAGTAEEIYARHGYNYAFEQTRNILRRSDIVFGNLEGPLATWGPVDAGKTYSFKSKPRETAAALKYGGFDIVSLANNHTLDYGAEGMMQTMFAIGAEGILHVGGGLNENGARQYRIIEKNGVKVAFLAYSLTLPETFWATPETPGTAYGKHEHVVADVQAAKKEADVVLVSMHWGRESTTELRPYQESIGRAAIDAGASIIIGHHPHILQAVERYKDGIIFYSLGNFAFGSYSEKVDSSVIVHAYFKDNKISQVRFWPINVRNVDVLFQSKLHERERAHNVVRHLQVLSLDRGVDIRYDDGAGVIDM